MPIQHPTSASADPSAVQLAPSQPSPGPGVKSGTTYIEGVVESLNALNLRLESELGAVDTAFGRFIGGSFQEPHPDKSSEGAVPPLREQLNQQLTRFSENLDLLTRLRIAMEETF